MEALVKVPEWLGAAVIGALVAALGYVGKLIIESWQGIREAQNARRARLVELQSTLRAAWVSFAVQNNHAKRLLLMIQETHPDLIATEEGYERMFSKAFKIFTPDEKELHAIIRSITVHSLRSTNQSLSNWLKSDTYFKSQKRSQGILGELAEKTSRPGSPSYSMARKVRDVDPGQSRTRSGIHGRRGRSWCWVSAGH